MALITPKEWNDRQPRPRSIEQVRRWVRSGRIQPPPILDGREYLVEENAVKVHLNGQCFSAPVSKNKLKLKERIRHGRSEKKP
ncbi:excisionase [Salmonella enterica]|uniref:Excisionase n=2 Tax=Salmonella enterica subsp. salamae TaxID=59202 RepID=A0A5Y1WCW1_SALER|nr:excisionase [Salmonella enterica]EBP3978465.1 excisionase [Salmonella enterica subsp. enterica]ECC1605034.1 excisionase [Salmonella enterica subsp. salamae]EDU6435076.1 excisionase [Salmonella enterica subsp. salamae serovar 47:b:e,n,x,z15]EKR1459459.1 excisionase [Salmonella enterica subsp. salamae serovar 47:b:1,5]MBA2991221.1 excisionase [Salmonella enterica subsp. salamae serovar 47:z:e,n,x,z15]HAE4723966.1 excisionase [Salmonella enterica subsp. salamae serovar 47:a:1,5]